MSVDGHIVIDTKIEQTGISEGLKKISDSMGRSLKQTMALGAALRKEMDLRKTAQSATGSLASITNSLKSVAAAFGVAFGAKAITDLVKTAVGSFSLMSSSFGVELKSLQWAFLDFQGALVNSLAPAFAAIYPYILGAIHYLTALFTTISQMSLAFFGLAASTNAAKLAQLEMNKAVGAGAMAGFDQLNVLNAKPILPGVEIPPDVQAKVDAFKTSALAALQPLFDAFDRLRAALAPLGKTIWEGLEWAWNKIIEPIGKWAMNDAIPRLMDLIGAAGQTLNQALMVLKPLGDWLYEKFLKPVGEWTGKAFLDAMDWVKQALKDIGNWITNNQAAFQNIVIIVGSLAAGFLIAAAAVAIGTAAATAFGAVLALVTSPIFLVGLAIGALIAIIVLLVRNWDWVSQKASEVWAWVQGVWDGVGAWFMTNVVDPIKAAFQPVFDWLGKAWETVWNGIGDVVKGVVNTIIDFINTMIRAIAGGINAVVDAMNTISVSIPSWVPFIGGQTWGLNIPRVGVPQIPRLATGAVIPPNAQFAAILGDQSSGRNIEAPENLMRQIISEELGKIQADITIRFDGTMAQFVQQLKPVLDRENVRIGGNLIQGVVRV